MTLRDVPPPRPELPGHLERRGGIRIAQIQVARVDAARASSSPTGRTSHPPLNGSRSQDPSAGTQALPGVMLCGSRIR